MKKIEDKEIELTKVITDFLVYHPAISVNKIEKTLSIPQGTINRAIKGSNHIPSNHIYPLFCELSRYGMKYNGCDLKYDADVNTLLAYKIGDLDRTIETRYYPDGSTKDFEINDDSYEDEESDGATSSSFTYLHKVDKILFTSYFDLF